MSNRQQLELLQLLKYKLSRSNRRSIYLNVLPGNRLNRLDALHLAHLDNTLPQLFLETLLTQPRFSLLLSYNNKEKALHALNPEEQKILQHTTRRLDTLLYDNKDHLLEYGTEPFGFGYPILLRRDTKQPDKLIKAPLFIWSLSIEKLSNRLLTWKIGRNEEMPVYINPVLLAHLENDTDLNLKKMRLDYADDFFINQQELTDICNQLLQQLNADHEYAIPSIALCPDNNTLQHISINKPLMRWSGVFGLFQMPKQTIIRDLNLLIDEAMHAPNMPIISENKNENVFELENYINPNIAHDINNQASINKSTAANDLKISAVQTDPSQQAIVNHLADKNNTYQIIQGPPGTGKSQSLTAIITHALASGKRCLVVCQKRAALEVLQQNLAQLNLSNLSVLIEDSDRDRQRVVDAARQMIDEPQKIPPFNQKYAAEQEKNAIETAKILQKQHDFLDEQRLDTYKWTDLVGKFCAANAIQDKSILDDPLFNMGLNISFNAENYRHLRQIIDHAKPYYNAVNTLYHPLGQINKTLYAHKMSGELYQFIEQYTKQFIAQIKQTIHKAEQLITNYENQINDFNVKYTQKTENTCQAILQAIDTGNKQYGNHFDNLRSIRLWFTQAMALLSNKQRGLLNDRQTIIAQYAQIADFQSQNVAQIIDKTSEEQVQFVNIHALAFEPENDFSLIAQRINALLQAVAEWKTTQKNTFQDYITHFNANTLHKHTKIDTDLEAYLNDYKKLINSINETQFFNANLPTDKGNVYNTLNDANTGLKTLLAQFSTIQLQLPQFKAFYQWQHFFVTKSPEAQTILIALIKSNASNWIAAFDSWYLNNWLIRMETSHVPQSDLPIKTLAQNMQYVSEQMPNAILNYWQTEQSKRIDEFNLKQTTNFNVKRLYNKRSTQDYKRSTLRQIIQTDFELFTAFFPVCLTNPVVCSTIFPLVEGLFDLIIFDEAGQLRIEDTYCALYRGKSKIISGDIHQMPPSDYFASPTLLLPDTNASNEDENPENDLDNSDMEDADSESLLTYAENRNFEQAYLDFHYRSQHPYLIDFSNTAFYRSRLVPMPAKQAYMPIHFVQINGLYKNNSNEAEANAIIDYLLTIDQTKNKQSIGIATFNLQQRNLILDKLQAIKVNNDAVADKITALEAAGLFVKNLENIQGDERDIILLSTTFGKRDDGKFIQNFGNINRSKGYRLLNVIITRARIKMGIFTSIPPEYYSRYSDEINATATTGKTYFYAYLAYAKAVSQNNEPLRQQILAQLSQTKPILSSEQIIENQMQNAVSPKHTSTHNGELFIKQVAQHLQDYFPISCIKTHYTQGGIVIPIAIFSPQNNQPLAAIECDNAPDHHSPVAYMHDLVRERHFAQMGFKTIRIYAADWWLNPAKTLQTMLESIKANV